MEKKEELNLEELDQVSGGDGSSSPNGTTATPASGNNGGTDTTLPGITFSNK